MQGRGVRHRWWWREDLARQRSCSTFSLQWSTPTDCEKYSCTYTVLFRFLKIQKSKLEDMYRHCVISGNEHGGCGYYTLFVWFYDFLYNDKCSNKKKGCAGFLLASGTRFSVDSADNLTAWRNSEDKRDWDIQAELCYLERAGQDNLKSAILRVKTFWCLCVCSVSSSASLLLYLVFFFFCW